MWPKKPEILMCSLALYRKSLTPSTKFYFGNLMITLMTNLKHLYMLTNSFLPNNLFFIKLYIFVLFFSHEMDHPFYSRLYITNHYLT